MRSGHLFKASPPARLNMAVPSEDDAVLVQKGKNPGDPHVITINCPDKTGLACDIFRTILDFGLYITKGDFSTDGRWCYVVLWAVPHCSTPVVRWPNLKNRLQSVCPTCSVSFYLNQPSPRPASSPLYMLTFCCLDRTGLLHDVTQVLCELELAIQKVKVTTTPDGRVLDLFFITDNLELLHTKTRQDEACEQLRSVLGESCISCELQLAGSQYDHHQGSSSLSPVVADELFRCEPSDNETCAQALSPDMKKLKNASVTADNSLSPAHTLLQIQCIDHKGLLYDIMRTLKDCNIQIAYGRLGPVRKGNRELDLFVQQMDGKKIVDPEKQSALCSRLKVEMLHPLRVIIANRGPDTELLVANPVELAGMGKPRVFYEVTLALKTLGICIFSAEIGRHSTADREWEVCRFLLDENCKFELSKVVVRNQIVNRVRRTLMGW
ncbi:ACT domain-containing protein ACR9 [Camellia lanceoleosa]|uniref:ACT domain-containing protein ACR9 n=1 Tax=Camellia lanceoleosa TaxID=1840588 RepID=A0ACC0F3L9_9ERIC|nr:ACT domain-containing protein ACR9 [Camellia lanceoleosa]